MIKREGRHTSRTAVLALLFSCALSSCQNSLLEGYRPSDDFKDDWDSIKAFNRWIDPRVGAFLFMEESYIDLNRFDLEQESMNLEGKVTGRLFRSKSYSDLSIVTRPLDEANQELIHFEAPGRYVERIYWQNNDLTFLGCHFSDGPSALGKAFSQHFDELPVGQEPDPHRAWFDWSNSSAHIDYHCVPVEFDPEKRNTKTETLFDLSCKWQSENPSIPQQPHGFLLDAYERTFYFAVG